MCVRQISPAQQSILSPHLRAVVAVPESSPTNELDDLHLDEQHIDEQQPPAIIDPKDIVRNDPEDDSIVLDEDLQPAAAVPGLEPNSNPEPGTHTLIASAGGGVEFVLFSLSYS